MTKLTLVGRILFLLCAALGLFYAVVSCVMLIEGGNSVWQRAAIFLVPPAIILFAIGVVIFFRRSVPVFVVAALSGLFLLYHMPKAGLDWQMMLAQPPMIAMVNFYMLGFSLIGIACHALKKKVS